MAIKLEDIRNILILGSGTLGMRIGLQAALSGYHVTIYDIKEKAFDSARKVQGAILRRLEKAGKISADDAAEALARIRFTVDAEDAGKDADLVSESVFEDVQVKKEVWSRFGAICPAHTVFTTNTSYLLPSMFAEETGRPNIFCAFHFHDVFDANVVDVMPHPGTEPWVVDLLMELGHKLNQVPVLVQKESPGYITNAMLLAFMGAAGNLVTSGVASVEDVDKSWVNNFKMPHGPFQIMDNIGLDTVWYVCSNQKDRKSQAFAEYIKTYIDAGKLGVKSGEGFYKYRMS